jgi:hypothetical protein
MRHSVVIVGIVVLAIAAFLYVGGASLYDYSYNSYQAAMHNNQLAGSIFITTQKIDTSAYENTIGQGRLMAGLSFLLIFIGVFIIIVGFVIKKNNYTRVLTPFGKKTTEFIEEKCKMCGKPKGSTQFYFVMKDDTKLNVCEECADEIEKEDKVKIEKSSVDDIENGKEDDPLFILQLRYVQGEITKEQYEQMKKDLNE